MQVTLRMRLGVSLSVMLASLLSTSAGAADDAAKDAAKKPDAPYAAVPPPDKYVLTPAKDSITLGSIKLHGEVMNYQAVAGTVSFALHDLDQLEAGQDPKDEPNVAMFYTAYFKTGVDPVKRPVVFLYNGGPGSSSLWLHMGSFGPVRVLTPGDRHLPAAPYPIVPNAFSLLDVADLVFIDAPGTGFSRIAGKAKEKAFYGIDADAAAFGRFINEFLTRHGRWNSPKYLFGESYGTTRSAALSAILQDRYSIDLNGIILLSQILDFATSVDGADSTPGNDLPYVLALPSYAAIAWYHKMLPEQPANLEKWLADVEAFAEGEYLSALQAGAALPLERRHVVAEQLHRYTGLPVEYLERADLRVTGGEFEQALQLPRGLATGRLDARFAGPILDPMDKESGYDPFSAAVGGAYVAAFNEYARKTLKYGDGMPFRASIDVWRTWDMRHQAPGSEYPGEPNVIPDLSRAMKANPTLRVLNLGGFFDLATPFFAAQYELRHLQIPRELRDHIEIRNYPSGHMIYARDSLLSQMHDDIALFIQRSSTAEH